MTFVRLSILLLSSAPLLAAAPQLAREAAVCMEVRPGQFASARIMSAKLFSRIGVRIVWRTLSRCPQGALRIDVSDHTPEALRPAALAYSMPFEGVHIRIFWDRIQRAVPPSRLNALLAYVLAHEIAHMLQGTAYHAPAGLMRAHWDAEDFTRMPGLRLPFTRDDIARIHSGMDRRLSAPRPPALPGIANTEAVE